jgi:DNA-binding NarL/FixJ family response regulator
MSKILLIDDHSIVRKGLLAVLKRSFSGADFSEADSFKKATVTLEQNQFEVVICDISLPDGSGLDILKAHSKKSHFIMLSMHEDNIYSNRALALGATSYICKGEDPQKLIDQVRNLLNQFPVFSNPEKAQVETQFPHEKLSTNETGVFLKLIKGKTNKEIAADNNQAPSTVGTYKKRILSKMKLKTQQELLEYAIRNKIL